MLITDPLKEIRISKHRTLLKCRGILLSTGTRVRNLHSFNPMYASRNTLPFSSFAQGSPKRMSYISNLAETLK